MSGGGPRVGGAWPHEDLFAFEHPLSGWSQHDVPFDAAQHLPSAFDQHPPLVPSVKQAAPQKMCKGGCRKPAAGDCIAQSCKQCCSAPRCKRHGEHAASASANSSYGSAPLPKQQQQQPLEDPLPQGWRLMHDVSGRPYYLNDVDRSTQWERPRQRPVPVARGGGSGAAARLQREQAKREAAAEAVARAERQRREEEGRAALAAQEAARLLHEEQERAKQLQQHQPSKLTCGCGKVAAKDCVALSCKRCCSAPRCNRHSKDAASAPTNGNVAPAISPRRQQQQQQQQQPTDMLSPKKCDHCGNLAMYGWTDKKVDDGWYVAPFPFALYH
jgi:hypothetical protein